MDGWDSISLKIRNTIKRCICAMRGQPNGIAPLDGNGQISNIYFPPLIAEAGIQTYDTYSAFLLGTTTFPDRFRFAFIAEDDINNRHDVIYAYVPGIGILWIAATFVEDQRP